MPLAIYYYKNSAAGIKEKSSTVLILGRGIAGFARVIVYCPHKTKVHAGSGAHVFQVARGYFLPLRAALPSACLFFAYTRVKSLHAV